MSEQGGTPIGERGFREYYEASEDKPLHPILESAKPWLVAGGLALDLGAGTGKATRFLADLGYRVVAVEPDPDGLRALREKFGHDPRVRIEPSRFEFFDPPECQAVVAVLSLFFLGRERLDPFLATALDRLTPGGVFVGQLLGPWDTWVAEGCAAHERAEVERLLAEFDLRVLDEVERESVTVTGEPKHWHVYHIVATKQTHRSVDIGTQVR